MKQLIKINKNTKVKSCMPYGLMFMQKKYCKLCSLNENVGADYSIFNSHSVLLMRDRFKV